MVINVDKFLEPDEAASIGGGFSVAPVSQSPSFVIPIGGVTQPSGGVLPTTSIDTQDHPDAAETGLKFEFQVPTDYDNGPVDLTITYAMSTAVAAPNNVVTMEIGAEIAKASDGAVDTASYPLASSPLTTPDNLTDVTRSSILLSISEGDFAASDRIVFFVKRLGADGGDDHTGVLQLIDYVVTYNAQVATRRSMFEVEVFSDTDEPPPPAGTLSSFDTLDFTTGVDQEQKFQFTIPDHWDGVSDFQFQFTYAMSSSAALAVKLQMEAEVTNLTSGGVDAIANQNFFIDATADTDVHRTTVARTILATGRTAGEVISFKVKRQGVAAGDTHTGNWKLLSGSVFLGTGASSSVSILSQVYLPYRDYTPVSGSTTESSEVVLTPDFERWEVITSSGAASRADFTWHGRLGSNQDSLSRIDIPILGNVVTSEYQIKIFAEGSGATPVFDDGSLQAATTSRTVRTIFAADLSAQPSGEKRFFVRVEMTLDNTEVLKVGTPFVRME